MSIKKIECPLSQMFCQTMPFNTIDAYFQTLQPFSQSSINSNHCYLSLDLIVISLFMMIMKFHYLD